jgi:hypothetical protein
MEIVGLDTVKQIGAEYGWEDAQLETALSTAIRLNYIERDQLVEADVNLELGSITARRRTGHGERGHWVDVDKPLLPTVKQLIEVMELLQYGDGSPGRVLEGAVSGYRDGGVIYRVQDNLLLVPENLLSVMDFHNRPELGATQVLALCSSKDRESGMRIATRRGREFVASVAECYYPGCISGIWMGASNSWAVIRMSPDDMSAWLENDGVNIKHLQDVLGLRRITLIPEGQSDDDQENRDAEVKHFINNAWRDCRIRQLEPELIELVTPVDQRDPRKLRTFTSMLKKIAPEREQVIY